MNILTDPEHLKNLMRSLKLKPKDYMGQNFLINQDVLNEIANAADLKKSDTVIEIGPGLGVLTELLAERVGKVVAIEKDRNFIPLLRNFYREKKNVEIVEQDILKYNFSSMDKKFKIVANIPYYLTSHLIQSLLALKNKPELIVLMVQREVAERLVADAGELSLLGISVQIFADAEIVTVVAKESFWPKPKVDSAVVRLKPLNKFPDITDTNLFFRILKIAFAGKRKQIHNTLSNGLKIPKEEILRLLVSAKIDPTLRPQDLTLEQWIDLYREIGKSGV